MQMMMVAILIHQVRAVVSSGFLLRLSAERPGAEQRLCMPGNSADIVEIPECRADVGRRQLPLMYSATWKPSA